MRDKSKDLIGALLAASIPRELIMAVEDGLFAGASRAYMASKDMHEGHLPSVVGQARHFHMNEAFHLALEASGAQPTSIRGNKIITGRAGVFRLARFNIPEGMWVNGRRSQTRRQMALANRAIVPLVRPGFFDEQSVAPQGVAFFVACFSHSLQVHPERPSSVQIAVPDTQMESWLFREPLPEFIKRYEVRAAQPDLARPKLKRRTSGDAGDIAGNSQ